MIPAEYLQSIRERLVDDWVVTSFRILRERATDADAYIRGVLELFDGSKLEFSEYVQVAPGSVIDVRRIAITGPMLTATSAVGTMRRTTRIYQAFLITSIRCCG